MFIENKYYRKILNASKVQFPITIVGKFEFLNLDQVLPEISANILYS